MSVVRLELRVSGEVRTPCQWRLELRVSGEVRTPCQW